MRAPQELPVHTTRKDTQADGTIPSTEDLRVTVTSAYQPKRRKRTFRVIQRPDGVIVEHPTYQKSLPILTPERHLQRNLAVRPIPLKLLKLTMGGSVCKDEELLGIGAFAGDTDRKGHGGFGTSTGGCNTLANNAEELKLDRYVEDACNGVAPMERFLAESGLWSSVSRRSG